MSVKCCINPYLRAKLSMHPMRSSCPLFSTWVRRPWRKWRWPWLRHMLVAPPPSAGRRWRWGNGCPSVRGRPSVHVRRTPSRRPGRQSGWTQTPVKKKGMFEKHECPRGRLSVPVWRTSSPPPGRQSEWNQKPWKKKGMFEKHECLRWQQSPKWLLLAYRSRSMSQGHWPWGHLI